MGFCGAGAGGPAGAGGASGAAGRASGAGADGSLSTSWLVGSHIAQASLKLANSNSDSHFLQ